MPKQYVNRTIPPAFAEKVAGKYTVDENGCWISTYKAGPNGYATATWIEQGHYYSTGVHRHAWTHHNGPIPDAMTIDHICFNRTCINPEHLRLMSNRDNARRRFGAELPEDGDCLNGHDEYFMKLYHWGKVPPQWGCSECLRERNDRGLALKRLQHTYGIILTAKQQAMVDEFMPQHERAALTVAS